MRERLDQETAPFLERMRRARALPRLLERDPTLWPEAQRAEATNRLGWLDLPQSTPRELPAWRALREAARSAGVEALLLVGMGGSSLGAAVLSSVLVSRAASLSPSSPDLRAPGSVAPPRHSPTMPASARLARNANLSPILARDLPHETLGRPPDAPGITVCDSTHPDHVRELLARLPPRRTWLVVATKSGTTAETRALAAVFRRWIGDGGGDSDRQSLAVTDAGSPLTAAATDWRAVVPTPADVGGRFSALSAYGLLLPALAGVDVTPVTDGASRCLAALARGETRTVEPLCAIAARLAVAAGAGWPLRIATHAEELAAWPGWLEQLLAESLGKAGVGLVPVAVGAGQVPGADALCVDFVLGEGADGPPAGAPADPLRRVLPAPATGRQASDEGVRGGASWDLARALGAEMLTWELVTSLVAWCLGTSPFDQPDVERSKRAARRALAGESGETEPPLRVRPAPDGAKPAADLEAAVRGWLATARDCAYATVQLFAAPGGALAEAVDALCGDLASSLGHTVTWGYGPRYLHSTGQLHKGGPLVAVLQLLVPPASGDLEVPGEAFGLWQLLAAQAAGDAAALAALDRPVLRLTLDGAAVDAVEALRHAVQVED